MPKTNTKEKLLNYLKEHGEVTPHQLVLYLKISPQSLYRHLKTLIQKGTIKKLGTSPRVFYSINDSNDTTTTCTISKSDTRFLDTHFYFVSPTGQAYKGLDAFKAWCKRQNLPIEKTIKEYKTTHQKYAKYKSNDIIDGKPKLEQTFDSVYLDELYYFDFYAIERFGKTKLGYFLLYSKQGQSLDYLYQLINDIKPKIQSLINDKKVDAIAFAPPTVKRDIQIMKLLEKECSFGLRVVAIEKLKTEIIVPQKTLSKLQDRIINAKTTMLVTEKTTFKKVLLVDDAVGSGSTLNEIAKQLKDKKICKIVIGLSITGSFKGFEVLNEV